MEAERGASARRGDVLSPPCKGGVGGVEAAQPAALIAPFPCLTTRHIAGASGGWRRLVLRLECVRNHFIDKLDAVVRSMWREREKTLGLVERRSPPLPPLRKVGKRQRHKWLVERRSPPLPPLCKVGEGRRHKCKVESCPPPLPPLRKVRKRRRHKWLVERRVTPPLAR